jgi:hypothetical protein
MQSLKKGEAKWAADKSHAKKHLRSMTNASNTFVDALPAVPEGGIFREAG